MTAAADHLPFTDVAPAHRRAIGRWLALWAGMVLLTVVIGGVTRLTESGLSITEWRPVSGVIPPLSESDWNDAFARYQQIPEYQELNRGMTLTQFKRIYLWEYGHRLWARLVGLALALPLAWFAVRRALTAALARRLALILALTLAQGALGWFMVRSGLTERTDVSQYRLAAHLGLALVIYVITVWTAADLLAPPGPDDRRDARIARAAGWVTAVIFLTAVAGAFVAGLDAGRVYNTFPLMGGRVVPPGYLQLTPAWRNLFENAAAAQFNHRLLAVLGLTAIVTVWWWARPGLVGRGRRLLDALLALAAIQVVLGVGTLLLVVPVWLAALHQAGAVLLLTAGLLLLHASRITRGSQGPSHVATKPQSPPTGGILGG